MANSKGAWNVETYEDKKYHITTASYALSQKEVIRLQHILLSWQSDPQRYSVFICNCNHAVKNALLEVFGAITRYDQQAIFMSIPNSGGANEIRSRNSNAEQILNSRIAN